MVIGRAMIADLVTGRAAARAFTLMITVGGVAPVLAPLVGGLLADPVGWRGMLWTVVGLCAAMLVGVLLVIPETHPAEARRARRRRPRWTASGPSSRTRAFRGADGGVRPLLRGDDGLHLVLAVRLPERRRALDEVGYGVAFGVNAAGLIGLGWVASRLVDRWSPRQHGAHGRRGPARRRR